MTPLQKRLRDVAGYSRRWERELIRLMCEARAAGVSLREIAELVGVSHETVRQATATAGPSSTAHHMPIAKLKSSSVIGGSAAR